MTSNRLLAIFALIGMLTTIISGLYIMWCGIKTIDAHTLTRQDPFMSGSAIEEVNQ